jgi:nucleotide-binding universal stress UspA family protein
MATITPAALTFEHILVPTDLTDISQRALEYAKALAKPANAELLLVHVSPLPELITPPEAAWVDVSGIQEQVAEQLEQTGAALRSEGYRARAISLTGSLHHALLSTLKENKVDLLVVGTHGKKGLERFLTGSDAEALLRGAPCPVLCVGPAVPALHGETWRIREIICATSLDANSAPVAALAQKLAAFHQAVLVLFHVQDPDTKGDVDYESFEEALRSCSPEDLGRYAWLQPRGDSRSPGASIIDLATSNGADLIVMGAHSASPIATHVQGGIVAEVLAHAPCPVMTLPQR